jgi:hypothetical protein
VQALYSDEAKRIADEMSMHAVAGSRGWAVFALSDGSPLDHTAYPTWNRAVKAAKWDRDNYMFAEIPPDGMPPSHAQAILKYARFMHSQGWRIPNPDWEHGQATSMPYQPWDRARMAKQLVSGKPLDVRGYSNVPSAFRKAS